MQLQRKLFQPFANGTVRIELDMKHPKKAINESFMDTLLGFVVGQLYAGLIDGANRLVAKHGQHDGGTTSVKQLVQYRAGATMVDVRVALKVRDTVRESKLLGLLLHYLADLHALVDFIEDELEHAKQAENVFSEVRSMLSGFVIGAFDPTQQLEEQPLLSAFQETAASCGEFAVSQWLNGNHNARRSHLASR